MPKKNLKKAQGIKHTWAKTKNKKQKKETEKANLKSEYCILRLQNQERELEITRALTSLPFLPRSLVTTTLGAEIDQDVVGIEAE